jgi:Putative Flp pilus-assembly TadE/G-like
MRTPQRQRARDDRGAVLVHVAVAILALLAFSALAIDLGAMWVGRRQAQNAADAAALAGALSLAFDSPADIPRAREAARAVGVTNLVWGAAPSIDLALNDVQLVPCPPGAPGLPDTCIRADVFRSAGRGNALPTFFAQIANVNSQDVRATATAQVLTANAVECLKPWAVADKWDENWENGAPNNDPWTTTSVFDKYKKQGGSYVPDPAVTTPDVYIPPTADSPGTGFAPFDANGNPTTDYGLQFTLKIGSSENRLSSGWFMALDLPNPDGSSGSGANDYRNNIKNCNGTVFQIGDTLNVSSEQGNMIGPTRQGVEGGGPGGLGLMQEDPGASWNAATNSIQGSCAPGVCADGLYHATSPRIVPVALFDIDAFFAGSPNGKTTVTITNILGFFIEGMGGQGNKDVIGRLVAIPGLTQGGGSVDETAAFLRKVILVR